MTSLGPSIIRRCGTCREKYTQFTYASLTLGSLPSGSWTDGHVEWSHPSASDHQLVKCPSCSALQWLDAAEFLDKTYAREGIQGFLRPGKADYELAMATGICRTPTEARGVRVTLWQMANHPFRQDWSLFGAPVPGATSNMKPAELAQLSPPPNSWVGTQGWYVDWLFPRKNSVFPQDAIDNMSALLDLLATIGDNDARSIYMRAEVSRELGQFNAASQFHQRLQALQRINVEPAQIGQLGYLIDAKRTTVAYAAVGKAFTARAIHD